jgi:hypothetical protein
MSRNTLLLLPIVVVCLLSCEPSPPPANFEKSLTGQWEVTAFQVLINSAYNGDSSYLMEVPAGAWPERMQQYPERIHFMLNNRFTAENTNLDDELAYQRRGMWDLRNDTMLRLIEPKGTDDYRLYWLNADAVTLYGLLDHDGDGRSDDVYNATWHRIRPDSLTASDQ